MAAQAVRARMRLNRLVLPLALVLLAAPALAAEPTGATMPWHLDDCFYAYTLIPFPAARVTERMPPGFRAMLGTQATAGLVTHLGFEIDDCASGSGLDGAVAGMQYASTWVQAEAPPKHKVPGVMMFVNFDVLVPDDDRRAVLAQHGTPARDGLVTPSRDVLADPLLPFRVDYTMEGVGDFRFDVAPQPKATQAGGPSGEFAQYTLGENGSLTYWRTKWDASYAQNGEGVVHLPEGSWYAEAAGATVLPAHFTFGRWDYHDGRIVLPTS